jgi:hypothetical protein
MSRKPLAELLQVSVRRKVIDDVRIYNRALSAAEVQQLYKLGTVTVRPN